MEDKLLLTPKNINPTFDDWEVKGILNPAAIRMPNGKICLYARVAEAPIGHGLKSVSCPVIASQKKNKIDFENIHNLRILKKGRRFVYLKEGTFRLTTFSHFKKIILSKDGFNVEKIIQKPAFTGIYNDGDYGVEDARFTKIGDKYYMTYVAVSYNEGVSTSLAVSKNLSSWKRLGLIFREQNKDVVLFPQKIRDKYVALHRPEGNFEFSKPSIWISYSPDLIYWGKDKSILRPRKGAWEDYKLGAGPPPIKTKKGWLLIYHGIKKEGRKKLTYSAGAALLDIRNPEKILARSPRDCPLFRPTKPYEKRGFVNRVVFPSGIILDKDKKHILLYSGGADDVTSVRKIALKDIFNNMEPVRKKDIKAEQPKVAGKERKY